MRTALSLSLSLCALLAGGTAVTLSGCRAETTNGPAQTQKWICPMHPQVVKEAPGSCPICGMKLVPMGATPVPGSVPTPSSSVAGFSEVVVDAQKRQLLGLKTVRVEHRDLASGIRTVGRVAFDETRIHHIHTKFDAYVEHVHANFTGAFVKRGEPLVELYSPDLLATQQEYLLALRAQRSLGSSPVAGVSQGGVDLLEAAKRRLLLWDMSPGEIASLERRGEASRTFTLHAPITGYVIGKMAVHGMKVSPADSLFDIADLSRVWVLADVYEYELPLVAVGQEATMTLSYWPGRAWKGKVTYVFPTIDEKSRTVKVRLESANPGGELKPEMFADVEIEGRRRRALAVPEDAVLDSGTRKVVFVVLGEGRLQPREVATGGHSAGLVEITSGLKEGEEVTLGANFLVDSESRLKAAIQAFAR